MKITGNAPVRTTTVQRQKRSGKTSAAGFGSELREETGVRSAGASAGAGAISALLSVQEVGDFSEERRRAVRHGEDILERLDELRHGLLIGAFPKDKLDPLLAVVRRQPDRLHDPRLKEVLEEIELRAMVELAKLSHVG